jgi:iron complex transport system ATP-binding protein
MSEMALLKARHLGVSLSGRVVLKDVSLALAAGHLVALVGPNGAGKTTRLRALAGLIPSDGEIEIGGQSLASLPLRERAKRFGYLPQGHMVHWPLPARDIVALGRYPHGATDPARLSPKDAEAVLRAMQAVDVMEFSERRVTELSGGERSRVALARALAVEAPVILADEPTASLDPRHQIDVMQNLRAAADKGVLVVVAEAEAGQHPLRLGPQGVAPELLEAGLGLAVGGQQLVVLGVVGDGEPVGEVLEAVGEAGDVRGAGEGLVEHRALLCGVQVLGEVPDAQVLGAVDLARVGLLRAHQDLEQRGLAQAVAADEGLAPAR